LPVFFQSLIKSLLYENQINKLLIRFEHEQDIKFVDQIIDHLNISLNYRFLETLDKSKRYVFVCNHPMGILDGIIMLKALSSDFDSQIIGNDILNHIPNLKHILLPINWIGKITKQQTINIVNAFKSDKQIILFPAKEVSKLGFSGIKDKKWHPFFIKKSKQFNRDIVPVFIAGRNSFLFYLTSTIRSLFKLKFNVEMFLLIHEVFNKKDQLIQLKFGKPISYKSLLKKDLFLEADKIQTSTYSL